MKWDFISYHPLSRSVWQDVSSQVNFEQPGTKLPISTDILIFSDLVWIPDSSNGEKKKSVTSKKETISYYFKGSWIKRVIYITNIDTLKWFLKSDIGVKHTRWKHTSRIYRWDHKWQWRKGKETQELGIQIGQAYTGNLDIHHPIISYLNCLNICNRCNGSIFFPSQIFWHWNVSHLWFKLSKGLESQSQQKSTSYSTQHFKIFSKVVNIQHKSQQETKDQTCKYVSKQNDQWLYLKQLMMMAIISPCNVSNFTCTIIEERDIS